MDKGHKCVKQNLNIFRETTHKSIFMTLDRKKLNKTQKLEARNSFK